MNRFTHVDFETWLRADRDRRRPAKVRIGDGVRIALNADIDVDDLLVLGDDTVIMPGAIIEGSYVEIGRQGWIASGAHIGGGSCHGELSMLKAGDFLHMGRNSHVNIARRVDIGDEVGIGRGSEIYTHGSYLSQTEGFPVEFAPVSIGSRVWLPKAIVLPGISVGSDVVVSAMSLVNKDLPSGCLAGGIPARVIKENAYPVPVTDNAVGELAWALAQDTGMLIGAHAGIVTIGETRFDVTRRRIMGPCTDTSERVRDQMRRRGVRFRYGVESVEGGGRRYVPWG